MISDELLRLKMKYLPLKADTLLLICVPSIECSSDDGKYREKCRRQMS